MTQQHKSGLSNGAKIGIGVGVGVGLACLIIGLLIGLCIRRPWRRLKSRPHQQTAEDQPRAAPIVSTGKPEHVGGMYDSELSSQGATAELAAQQQSQEMSGVRSPTG